MRLLDTGIIYRNPIPHIWSRQAYFPSLARLADGTLVAAFSIGQAFESADLHSYVSISADNGKTWSEPKELVPRREGWSDFARISLLPDGSLIGMIQWHDRSRPDTGLTNPETLGFTETEFSVIRSRNGLEWSAPEKVAEPLVGPSFEMCCPIRPTKDGTLLFPTSTWQSWDGARPNGVKAVAFVSADNGSSWSYIDVMADPKDEIIYWESRICELPDGRLLATAWVYDSARCTDLLNRYALGTAEGFQPPRSTGLTGQTMEPIVLPDGRILTAYRRTDKPGLWGNLSHIEGGEWINDGEALLWTSQQGRLFATGENMVENFNVLRFGAPNGFVDTDGTCLICFWCVEDTVSNIRWVRIEP